jgi:hypothetical protein
MYLAYGSMASWVVFVAAGCFLAGFCIFIVGLSKSLRSMPTGARTRGEAASRANKWMGDFYTLPQHRRERMLVFVGGGICFASLCLALILIWVFGQPLPPSA